MLDTLITNALILDGSGKKPFKADVGIKNGVIQEIGCLSNVETKFKINARELILAPGFIDVHSHNDLVPFMKGEIKNVKIEQGVTTEIVGQCGLGPAPCVEKEDDSWKNYVKAIVGEPQIEWNWPFFSDFLELLEQNGVHNNICTLVTHGAVRSRVMGLAKRQPTDDEIKLMEQLVNEALQSGAFGMSVGLQYLPGIFSENKELVRLFRCVAKFDGIIMIHLRNHSHYMIKAMEEAINIAKETDVKIHISHMRSYRPRDWCTTPQQLLKLVDKARQDGIRITFDQHHYTAGSTLLSQVLPPWITEGGPSTMIKRLKKSEVIKKYKRNFGRRDLYFPGWDDYAAITGWEKLIITSVNKNTHLIGKSINEIAKLWKIEPIDAAFRLLIEEGGSVCCIMLDIFSEKDIEELIKHPLQMVGSDSIPTGVPHPRLYGSFPLFIGKYIREKGTISLPEAIYKITYLPANILGLKNRGLIAPGMVADIVIFDQNKIGVEEDYLHPQKKPQGIHYVFVNGKLVLSKGHCTEEVAGSVIRCNN